MCRVGPRPRVPARLQDADSRLLHAYYEQVERQGPGRQRCHSGSADAVPCGPRWLSTWLCEAEDDRWSPALVAVVRGPAHGSGHSCAVGAASRAGES